MADYKPKENYPGFDKDLDMEGVELKDIAEPSAADSAATKGYVDTLSASVDDRILKATVTLTAAQIKALGATPIALIAAPGAGKSIVVEKAVFRFNWVGVQYANGSALSLIYDTGSTNLLAGTLAATFLTAPTAAVVSDAAIGALGTQLELVQNKSVKIKAASTEFATGDSTMTVVLFYRIV
jgi:hypothetical protein